EGDQVLVTAARSHTSLFAINALRKYNANVYALTTSKGYEEQFARLGVKDVLQVDPDLIRLSESPRVLDLARSIGGFTHVIDPFWDIYLPKVVHVMKPGARYISCGFWGQYQHLTNEEMPDIGMAAARALTISIANNLQILFNCLGTTQDLQNAIADYAAGKLDVVVDSVHTGYAVGDFLARTYTVPDRFGKVVYQYA